MVCTWKVSASVIKKITIVGSKTNAIIFGMLGASSAFWTASLGFKKYCLMIKNLQSNSRYPYLKVFCIGILHMANEKKMCAWPGASEVMQTYHNEEWGVPLHDDRKFFEFLILDAMQAGLSWAIVLNKREGYRKAFHNFDAKKVAKYDAKKIRELIKNPEIIRNKLKINSCVSNAQAFLKVQKEFGSFDQYIWQFTHGMPLVNNWKSMKQIPARTKESDAMSVDLKKRGFKFVGSTICYAFMQAAGMVNDHCVDCFRYKEVQKIK